MPMGAARWLAARLAEARLRVGKLMSPVTVSSDGISVSLDILPGGAASVRYDRFVIATGPEYRLSKSRNPLIRQMLECGLAKLCVARSSDGRDVELGGFLTSGLELVDLPRVYAMGAAVRGEYFAVHSFPALRRHARMILDGIERAGINVPT